MHPESWVQLLHCEPFSIEAGQGGLTSTTTENDRHSSAFVRAFGTPVSRGGVPMRSDGHPRPLASLPQPSRAGSQQRTPQTFATR